MIPINDPRLYARSLEILATFTGRRYYGRLVQIFIACKYYGSTIPRVGASTGIDIATMQYQLDELYEKPSKSPTSVVSLFSNSHLARTGEKAPGHSVPQNTWRNNFNLQKGFGCYATAAEFHQDAFRNASRTRCPHLQPIMAGQLEDATCALDTSDPKAEYRAEDHPKIFRIDPVTRDVFVFDPGRIAYYAPLITVENGDRLPIVPLIIALYFDSKLASARTSVDVPDFLADFGFTTAEASAYFNDDPAMPQNSNQISRSHAITWTRIAVSPALGPTPAPLPGAPIPRSRTRRPTSVVPTAAPPTAPPAGSHWWAAEQAVRKVLEDDGWIVIDVSRSGAGYDLRAMKTGTVRCVEVKSSGGRCSPTLTANEYAEARRLRSRYVVAIVENFDPYKPVSVLWIQDPARLKMGAAQVTQYSLPRSVWLPQAVTSIP